MNVSGINGRLETVQPCKKERDEGLSISTPFAVLRITK